MKKGDELALRKTLVILAIIIYIVTVIALSFLADSKLENVFIGTIPVLIYLVLFFSFYTLKQARLSLMWVVPLGLAIAFYIIWNSRTIPAMQQLEGGPLTVFNIMLSYLMNVFFLMFLTDEKPHQLYQKGYQKQQRTEHEAHQAAAQSDTIRALQGQVAAYKQQLAITKENFQFNLRSIEDKCKAINFVIGRVYSDKKGGSAAIREKIKIPRDTYNLFSELTTDFKQEDASKLLAVLNSISRQLTLLESKEQELFELQAERLPVERDPQGSDSILTVLANNDTDPITDYHREAKAICLRLIQYIGKRSPSNSPTHPQKL